MKHIGAINFVVHKTKSRNHPATTAELLSRMGYGHQQLSEIFIEAGKSIESLQQELIAVNDFLPALNENLEEYFKEGNLKIFQATIIESIQNKGIVKFPLTLHPYPAPAPYVVDHMKRSRHMAITRHAFTFKLIYSLSITVLGIVLAYITIKLIEPSISIDQINFSYISPSMMTAIAIVVFLVAYVLQLFARRLHNAGINPWLSILIFAPVLPYLAKDQSTIIFSFIPALSVLILAMLTPTHRYRL